MLFTRARQLAFGTVRVPELVDLGLHLVGTVPEFLQEGTIRGVAVDRRNALGVADPVGMDLDEGLPLLG